MTSPDDLLVFNYDGLGSSIEALFRETRDNVDLRNQLLQDPAGVLSQRVSVLTSEISDSERTQANRFVFALLSNREFMAWADAWQTQNSEAALQDGNEGTSVQMNLQRLYQELTAAIWEYGDGPAFAAALGLDLHQDSENSELVRGDFGAQDILAMRLLRPPRPSPIINVNTTANYDHTVTFKLGLAVIAVVILIAVLPGFRAGQRRLGREELLSLTDSLSRALVQRASELRETGALRPTVDGGQS